MTTIEFSLCARDHSRLMVKSYPMSLHGDQYSNVLLGVRCRLNICVLTPANLCVEAQVQQC